MKLGIYSVSTQSGRAFLVDMLQENIPVYGYARTSKHGKQFVSAVHENNGIQLKRPDNTNQEESQFMPLTNGSQVGHDIKRLVNDHDIIIAPIPSIYLIDMAKNLKAAGIAEKRIPIVLSPSRTFATPYLWEILGDSYPTVCFSTSPFSCKGPEINTSYIKRRKRSWMASLEGHFTQKQINQLEALFPQALFNTLPATTSIGNIGAIFHPTPYLMNYDKILKSQKEGRAYSYYIEGIAQNAAVAEKLEEIDQVRLQIADFLGIKTFGLAGKENEDEWLMLLKKMRVEEKEHTDNLDELRDVRYNFLSDINTCVLSAQHWLDATYGVQRIPGESLQSAIGRTPTYQKDSSPQYRYIQEDVPTGLVPLLALAKRFDIDASCIESVLELYDAFIPKSDADGFRDLEGFSTEEIIEYLKGGCFKII